MRWISYKDAGKKRIAASRLRLLSAGHPVVLVSTNGPCGVNAAPFGMNCDVSYRPPIFMIGIATTRERKEGRGLPHTLQNIRATMYFVANLPGLDLLQEVCMMAKHFPKGVDEIAEAGLTHVEPSHLTTLEYPPPLIRECCAHWECKMIDEKQVGDHALIFGQVLCVSIDANLPRLSNQNADEFLRATVGKVRPVIHLGQWGNAPHAPRYFTTFSRDVIYER